MDIELKDNLVVITEQREVPLADFIKQKQLELEATDQDIAKSIERKNAILEELSSLLP